jgi:hypothetical protein
MDKIQTTTAGYGICAAAVISAAIFPIDEQGS